MSTNLQGVVSAFSYQAGTNRLASVSGGIVRNNIYDQSGNLTTDGTNTYTYDARGRLVNAIAGGYNTNYLINYQNLRVKKANSGAQNRPAVGEAENQSLMNFPTKTRSPVRAFNR